MHHRYKTWVEDGKQPLSAEELDKMFKQSEEQIQEENENTNDKANSLANSDKIFQWSIKVVLFIQKH